MRPGYGGVLALAGWPVDVLAGRQVAALDGGALVGVEVVAGAPVAGRRATTPAQWSRPIRTGWPGRPSYVARASAAAVAGGDHPADDVRGEVGQVDQQHDRRVDVVGQRGEAGAERGRHALLPVGGDDHIDAEPVQQPDRLGRAGAPGRR